MDPASERLVPVVVVGDSNYTDVVSGGCSCNAVRGRGTKAWMADQGHHCSRYGNLPAPFTDGGQSTDNQFGATNRHGSGRPHPHVQAWWEPVEGRCWVVNGGEPGWNTGWWDRFHVGFPEIRSGWTCTWLVRTTVTFLLVSFVFSPYPTQECDPSPTETCTSCSSSSSSTRYVQFTQIRKQNFPM